MTLLVTLLIILNLLVSYQGLKNQAFFEANAFWIDKILINKEYKRLITSGFLHVSWPHLLFNMFTLYAFGTGLEVGEGIFFVGITYLISLVGGNLLALFIHRNQSDYRAAGASGAVSGLVFACIALFPGMHISFFFIPIQIPGWIYGTLFMLYTIYGIRSALGNVGHDAHLGGAVCGMIFAIGIHPEVLRTNLLPILVMLVPSLAFILVILNKPEILIIGLNPKKKEYHNIDEKYNMERKAKQDEIDRILDKIAQHGIKSLSAKEKALLDEHARSGKG
jgi:membrane associated rhomboid family serine protease